MQRDGLSDGLHLVTGCLVGYTQRDVLSDGLHLVMGCLVGYTS